MAGGMRIGDSTGRPRQVLARILLRSFRIVKLDGIRVLRQFEPLAQLALFVGERSVAAGRFGCQVNHP